MGHLIIRLMRMVTDMKHGATLDEETCRLIKRVIGTEPTDDTIADFSTIVYTETFRQVMTSVLRQSLREGDHPILRHVYKNLLDIDQEMARHFYGFFTGNRGNRKTTSTSPGPCGASWRAASGRGRKPTRRPSALPSTTSCEARGRHGSST